jgi:hypothetical protein
MANVLSLNLSGWSEDYHENLRITGLGRDFNSGTPQIRSSWASIEYPMQALICLVATLSFNATQIGLSILNALLDTTASINRNRQY